MWAESTADDKADAINLTAAERTHKQKPLYSFSNSVAEHDNRPKQTACTYSVPSYYIPITFLAIFGNNTKFGYYFQMTTFR